MSELMSSDETLFSLWPDQQILPRPNGNDLSSKDQQIVPIPIVLLDDGRVAFRSDNGQLCLLDGLQGEGPGEDTVPPLLPVLEDPLAPAELPALTDASIKSLFLHFLGNTDPELPLASPSNELPEERSLPVLPCGDMPDLETKPLQDIPYKTISDLPPSPTALGRQSPIDNTKTLAVFNCQFCSHSTSEVHNLIHHFRTDHSDVYQQEFTNETQDMLNNTDQETESSSTADLPEHGSEEPERNVLEQIVFVCSECQGSFKSVDECRDHMIKDHNMVIFDNVEDDEDLIESDVNEKAAEENQLSPSSVPSAPPSSLPPPASAPLPQPAEPPPAPTPLPPSVIKVFKKRRQYKRKEYDPEFDAKPHKCRELFCVRKFRTLSSLEKHVECHLLDDCRKFCCPHCSMLFIKWGQCAIHLWKEHKVDVDLFTCKVCNEYKTTTLKKLESHSKIHSDERPFKCTDCGKGFKQRPQLVNHMSSVHKGEASTPKWCTTQKCEICLKSYADSKCLKKHMKIVHKKLKPYKCHICGHMSALKAMLQAHMRQHTGEKPFTCQLCSFKTGDHNSLRRHVMRHTGTRPYRCPHCPYSSIQSFSYKSHLMTRHPGQGGAYICSECYFSTVSKKSYEQHMSDHKLNLIPPSEVEVFPENVAAAHLVYRSFGASPSHIHCDVTATSTSLDGLKQTITISIPPGESAVTDDEDTSPYILGNVLDTGGITIPAEPEQQPLLCFN